MENELLKIANENLLGCKRIFVSPCIPEKKINTVLNIYTSIKKEDVMIVVDNTVFGGCKEGAIITNTSIFVKDLFQDPREIKLSYIKSVSLDRQKFLINNNLFYNFQVVDRDELVKLIKFFNNILPKLNSEFMIDSGENTNDDKKNIKNAVPTNPFLNLKLVYEKKLRSKPLVGLLDFVDSAFDSQQNADDKLSATDRMHLMAAAYSFLAIAFEIQSYCKKAKNEDLIPIFTYEYGTYSILASISAMSGFIINNNVSNKDEKNLMLHLVLEECIMNNIFIPYFKYSQKISSENKSKISTLVTPNLKVYTDSLGAMTKDYYDCIERGYDFENDGKDPLRYLKHSIRPSINHSMSKEGIQILSEFMDDIPNKVENVIYDLFK